MLSSPLSFSLVASWPCVSFSCASLVFGESSVFDCVQAAVPLSGYRCLIWRRLLCLASLRVFYFYGFGCYLEIKCLAYLSISIIHEIRIL